MTEDEFNSLPRQRTEPTCNAIDGPDRTLLYGYDCERNTFHVYQTRGVLNVVVYDFEGGVVVHGDGEMPCHAVVPDKRLYPEACDAEFCRLLMAKGVTLPFTVFDAERARRRGPGPFFGKRYAELVVASLDATFV